MKQFLFASVLVLLFSCNENAEENVINNPELDSLEAENIRLKQNLELQKKSVDDYVQYFNEVHENLNQIKVKHGLISTRLSANGEQLSEADLKADVEAIGELMAKNQDRINKLRKSLKNANIQSDEMERMIANLSEEVALRNMEVYTLQQELETIDAAYGEIFAAYQEKVEQLANTKDELNTAYFAFGTSKELKENGVITKEGGFIGIGRTEKLKSDFNQQYFTEVDITKIESIPLGAKKVELVTHHPEGSYKITGEDVKERLEIVDAKQFWSVSKYLVVVIE